MTWRERLADGAGFKLALTLAISGAVGTNATAVDDWMQSAASRRPAKVIALSGVTLIFALLRVGRVAAIRVHAGGGRFIGGPTYFVVPLYLRLGQPFTQGDRRGLAARARAELAKHG
jgi:hypothetical protein